MPSAPAFEIEPDAKFQVTFATDKGDIVAQLDARLAPNTVNNFVVQARNGFYDGLTFHRVVPGFVIQGGDPKGTGTGGPGYKFADEPVQGALRARGGRHGQRRARHQRVAVLHLHRGLPGQAPARSTTSSATSRAASRSPRPSRWATRCTRSPSPTSEPRPPRGGTVPEELNLAALHEAIAAVVPDRECLVWRGSAAELGRGHGPESPVRGRPPRGRARSSHRPLADCAGWESPHDHVALYLHNGNEYLESLLGAAKARTVGVNVNYRYVAEELRYLLVDCGARAIVYHGAFADHVAGGAPYAPRSPAAPPGRTTTPAPRSCPGALDYEAALASGRARRHRPTSALTTSTSSTRAAPPACPRACSGARPTSWPPASASRRPPSSS